MNAGKGILPRMLASGRIAGIMERSFSARGKKPAIIDSFGCLSYSSLYRSIRRVVKRLSDMGIGKGDCVAIDRDGRDLIIFTFAVMSSGACAVAVPRQCVWSEREALFKQCSVTAIISGKADGTSPDLLGDIKEEGLDGGSFLFRRLSEPPLRVFKDPACDAAFVRFTSGTTGKSKGVLFTERSIVERVNAANRALSISEEDVILWVLPMAYHFIVSIILYLYAGACITIPENKLPQTIRETIKRDRVTVVYANEYFFKLLLSKCSGEDLKSVKKVFSTAVGLSEAIASAFHGRFGIPISQAYGIIEVGLPFVNVEKPVEKVRSVGRVLSDYQVRILNDDGRPVKRGEVGEVVLKGCGFFDAYLSPYRPRDEVCEDGWFNTGDMGSLDDEGFLYLVGRKKDVINCVGMKVFPSEIEEVLSRHADVRAVLVKAGSHPYLTEVPHAIIVVRDKSRRPKEADLISFCAERLSTYKIPRSFEFVDALPVTGSGKVRRY